MCAPIVVFAYKRPTQLSICLKSLENNNLAQNSEVYIFIDGPKSEAEEGLVDASHEVAKGNWNFAKTYVTCSENNLGLAASIRSGVSKVLSIHGSAIIVEDDLIVHRSFLKFMNDSLDRYVLDPQVASIQGFSMVENEDKKCYFLRGADCWGWATWNERWKSVNWNSEQLKAQIVESKQEAEFNYLNSYNFMKLLDLNTQGKIDSWAIDWQASMFIQHRYSVYPPFNLVENNGDNNQATHISQNLSQFQISREQSDWIYPDEISTDPRVFKYVADKYLELYPRPVLVSKVLRSTKNFLHSIAPHLTFKGW